MLEGNDLKLPRSEVRSSRAVEREVEDAFNRLASPALVELCPGGDGVPGCHMWRPHGHPMLFRNDSQVLTRKLRKACDCLGALHLAPGLVLSDAAACVKMMSLRRKRIPIFRTCRIRGICDSTSEARTQGGVSP